MGDPHVAPAEWEKPPKGIEESPSEASNWNLLKTPFHNHSIRLRLDWEG